VDLFRNMFLAPALPTLSGLRITARTQCMDGGKSGKTERAVRSASLRGGGGCPGSMRSGHQSLGPWHMRYPGQVWGVQIPAKASNFNPGGGANPSIRSYGYAGNSRHGQMSGTHCGAGGPSWSGGACLLRW